MLHVACRTQAPACAGPRLTYCRLISSMSVAPRRSTSRMTSSTLLASTIRTARKLTLNVWIAPLLLVPAAAEVPLPEAAVAVDGAGALTARGAAGRVRRARRPEEDAEGDAAVDVGAIAAGALAGVAEGADGARPRSGTPCFCSNRYSDESPIPNRSRISPVDVVASRYRRTTSSCSLSVSLGRRPGRLPLGVAAGATPPVDWSVASMSSTECITQPYTRLIHF